MALKPSAKPRATSLNGLNTSGGDQRQTVCSVCRYGIYVGQPREWSRRPLGLVHTECATEDSPCAN